MEYGIRGCKKRIGIVFSYIFSKKEKGNVQAMKNNRPVDIQKRGSFFRFAKGNFLNSSIK
jgi:hypothetical protein